MIKSIHRCTLCGAEFTEGWEDAYVHERLHISTDYHRPEAIAYDEKDPSYPTTVRVNMDDGAVVEYKKVKVVQGPTPPENGEASQSED